MPDDLDDDLDEVEEVELTPEEKRKALEQKRQRRREEKARFMMLPLDYKGLEREALARANYMTKMSTAYNAQMMELARLARNTAASMRRGLIRDTKIKAEMNELHLAGKFEEEDKLRPERSEILKRIVWDGYVTSMHYLDFKEKERVLVGYNG